MNFEHLHDWQLPASDAIALQKELAERLTLDVVAPAPRLLAATDVSFNKWSNHVYAAVVVMDLDTMGIVDAVGAEQDVDFPYIPGLLSFRELPALLEAFSKLKTKPDFIICDGQGVAHPRRLGIASHLGLWLGIPTAGCAKSILCGHHEPVGEARGARSPLMHKGDLIGYAVRTRSNVKPVFISPGHLCTFEQAVEIVLAATPKFRLPAPIREAHNAANRYRTGQPLH